MAREDNVSIIRCDNCKTPVVGLPGKTPDNWMRVQYWSDGRGEQAFEFCTLKCCSTWATNRRKAVGEKGHKPIIKPEATPKPFGGSLIEQRRAEGERNSEMILSVFLENPTNSYSVTEIANKLSLSTSGVKGHLDNLVAKGMLLVSDPGRGGPGSPCKYILDNGTLL